MADKHLNLDKFYTNKDIVGVCYDAIKTHLGIDKKELIIEPSAGNGAFINIIKKLSNNYIFYDIKPENDEIIKKDFLDLTFEDCNMASGSGSGSGVGCHIIGNPPFGNKSSKAIAFIKHSTNILMAKSVSFILPISFKKASLQKSFPPNYHLVYQTVLAPNSFTHFGIPKNIKTVFQIWIKKDRARRVAVKITPASWYSFDKKENSDISIRRVGSKIGFVKLCEERDNTNTNWFIKINSSTGNRGELLGKLNSIRFNKENNVGPLSISKQDIIKKYNSIRLLTFLV
jgi:hypothetical protein